MSDKAQTKPEAKPKDSKDTNGVVKKQTLVTQRERTRWTLARCQKYARRFPNEAQWASGHQSSYKSAMGHGWLAECLAEIEKVQRGGGKVLSGAFGKRGGEPAPAGKKAA